MTDPSRNRSDSMEEIDRQQDRKRPRLEDDNSGAVDEALTDFTCPEQEMNVPSATDPNPSSHPTSTDSSQNLSPQFSPNKISSKVTINTRPTSSTAIMHPSTTTPGHDSVPDPINTPSHDPNKPISVTSSPSRSPEIEVAEPEDLDQDPTITKWTPVTQISSSTAAGVSVDSDYVYSTFPCANRATKHCTQDVVAEFVKSIRYNQSVLDREEPFRALIDWLQQFLQDSQELTIPFIVDDLVFWKEFPNLFQGLVRRKIDLPAHVDANLLLELCLCFFHLTLRFIDLDCSTIRSMESTVTESDLLSRPYLSAIVSILQQRNVPLYNVIRLQFGSDPVEFSSQVVSRLVIEPCRAVERLDALAQSIAEHLQRKPFLGPHYVECLRVVEKFVLSASIIGETTRIDQPLEEAMQVMNKQCWQYCVASNQILQRSITKQWPWLTIDSSLEMVQLLAISFKYLVLGDRDLAVSRLEQTYGDVSGVGDAEVADIFNITWKFGTFWKSITTGRMEIRAQGMEFLQQELIDIYQVHIRGYQAINHPLVRCWVDLLRGANIIEYLVGPESHPQLIHRSGNVIGYLAVSKAYTKEDSDVIWEFILENGDPRMVGEILFAMSTLLDVLDAPNLEYLFSKLFEFPISRFDSKIIDYCTRMISVVNNQRGHTHTPLITDMALISLFVRLVRAESASDDVPQDQRITLQRWALEHLSHFAHRTVLNPDMQQIWQMCIADIAEMNKSTCGSIRAIQALLTYDPQAALNNLGERHDYTRLIIQELTTTVEAWPENFTDGSFLQQDYICRIVSLIQIISYVPDTITVELAQRLWTCIFSSRKIGALARDYAWDSLSAVTEKCGGANSFIEVWTTEYLPRLTPSEYNSSTLKFAQASLIYEMQVQSAADRSKESLLASPGIDRMWHFILASPPDTVEGPAIKFLITFYLESRAIIQCAKDTIESIHISLVNRCIRQIITAASALKSFTDGTMSGEDEPMVLVASEEEIRRQELQFTRSLLFLRRFLSSLKSSPRFSPPPMERPDAPRNIEIRGEELTLKYQAFGGKKNPELSSIRIGDLNTGHDLAVALRERIGMFKFNGIHGGHIIELFGNHATLRELKIGLTGLLMLKSQTDASDKETGGRRDSFTHVDSEIVKNFDNLYELLDLDQHLAAEIFNFLQVFPVQQRVRDLIHQRDDQPNAVLPLDKPFKLLYSANALYLMLEDESFSLEPDEAFVHHCVRLLLATCDEHLSSSKDDPLQQMIVANLIDCLLVALRVRVSVETSCAYFSETQGVIPYALAALSGSHQSTNYDQHGPASRPVSCQSVALLVEAAMHDRRLWTHVRALKDTTALFKEELVEEAHPDVRKGIADVIFGLSGPPFTKIYIKSQSVSSTRSRFAKDKVDDLLGSMWPSLNGALPSTLEFPSRAQDIFEVALAIFRAIGDTQDIERCIANWATMFSDYVPNQVVGCQNDDHIVSGLARLLLLALDLLHSSGRQVKHKELLEVLFAKYLCPDLSDPIGDTAVVPSVPMLKSNVRQDLYALALSLCTDLEDFEIILDSVDGMNSQDNYEPQYQHERLALRSEAGHAGLRNLSNTCYLNSLFTQLYMNLEFREFIFAVESTQPLGIELKKLFAFMQNSWLRAVDPSNVVESIRTYENEAIDIAIQMDVDEFYNLLFDRLESQMPSAELKGKFRSMYGGQLVQQIKSKECDHISERLEPFSAIQCEIRGKSDLEESLRAYVEGEVMQGDNKYSCTACNRHVDAVKRACLKDVPDHLIFHLKRFDFDINTMTRCKINDEFAFPEAIDMAPYTVEHLNDEHREMSPDMFELVGVLVHSGTAESGHYYSFIRERPTTANSRESWTQFNDSDVSFFSHERLRDCCFGGIDSPHLRTSKVWSAYMLFYQRTTSVEQFQTRYPAQAADQPVRLDLPLAIGNHIAMENELFVRNYCAQDAAHARFISALLSRMRLGERTECSQAHKGETKIINLALEYIDQISSRFKDMPEVEPSFKLLFHYINSCPTCAVNVLQWLRLNQRSFRASVLRNPQQLVRTAFVSLIACSLNTLRGLAEESVLPAAELQRSEDLYHHYLEQVINVIDNEWKDMHMFPRAWNDYFDLLNRIASLGLAEIQMVLGYEYLERCLSMIWIEVIEDPKKIRSKYPNQWRAREKGRTFPYQGLLDLFATMSQYINLEAPRTGENHGLRANKYNMSRSEWALFLPSQQQRTIVIQWLTQILEGQYNPNATNRLIASLVESPRYAAIVSNTIKEGLEMDPASLAKPFLHAALFYCRCCPDQPKVTSLINKALELVDTIGDTGGQDNLSFLQHLSNLENPNVNLIPEDFREHLISRVEKWAPTLLTYPDLVVRSGTLELLNEYVLSELGGEDDDSTDETAKAFLTPKARSLALTIHRKLVQMKEDGTVSGGKTKLSRLILMQTSTVLDVVIKAIEDDGNPEWKDLEASAAWLRSYVDGIGSEKSEESDNASWINQNSDSEEQEMWPENGSVQELSTP